MTTDFLTWFLSFRVWAILFTWLMMIWLESTKKQWFTDCIRYDVWLYYTWWDTGKMAISQAWDNVCYRINKNWLQDVYIQK